MATTTVRRDKLQRDIAAGKMEARLAYSYDGRCVHSTDWKPCTIADTPEERMAAIEAGVLFFGSWAFKTHSKAYQNLDGTIDFTPAGDSYDLRYKDTRTEAQRESDAVADRLHEMDVYTR